MLEERGGEDVARAMGLLYRAKRALRVCMA